MEMNNVLISGPRFTVELGGEGYPTSLEDLSDPPKRLFGIGNLEALSLDSIAIAGARKATSYGLACTELLAKTAVQQGACIVSGGARGVDAQAHAAALDAGGITIAVLGGGCDRLYPRTNRDLFQRIVERGGCVVSEHDWNADPRPYMFRQRNRIIAALSLAMLVPEAGIPSGTFSAAEEAMAIGREVMAVPGSIFSAQSAGSNALLSIGSKCVAGSDSLAAALSELGFGCAAQMNLPL